MSLKAQKSTFEESLKILIPHAHYKGNINKNLPQKQKRIPLLFSKLSSLFPVLDGCKITFFSLELPFQLELQNG
ncbi:hypothetical protein [Bartonella rattaustraliani]|uniref:hypothetical protein n=1 Tax=Bartonella rattaustraliani TaxID=481139 RepID=UPI0012EAD481|nr:hypothetical protein [Bartonella rattaustraliani]